MRYHGDKHFSEFLPTRWRQKSTGIDMEQNYATVTLCIAALFDAMLNMIGHRYQLLTVDRRP